MPYEISILLSSINTPKGPTSDMPYESSILLSSINTLYYFLLLRADSRISILLSSINTKTMRGR